MIDYKKRWVEGYVTHVRVKALESSGDAARAEIAAQEARAQATGDYGIEGVRVFRKWLVATGRLYEKHIVATVILAINGSTTRCWYRWSDDTTSYSDAEYDTNGNVTWRQPEVVTHPPTGLRWIDNMTELPVEELEGRRK